MTGRLSLYRVLSWLDLSPPSIRKRKALKVVASACHLKSPQSLLGISCAFRQVYWDGHQNMTEVKPLALMLILLLLCRHRKLGDLGLELVSR